MSDVESWELPDGAADPTDYVAERHDELADGSEDGPTAPAPPDGGSTDPLSPGASVVADDGSDDVEPNEPA